MTYKAKYKQWLEPDNLLRIAGWIRDGLSFDQVAQKCGVPGGTFRQWVSKHPEIKEAVKQSQDGVDRKVENALFKRALGYEVEESKQTVTVSPDGEKTQKVEKITRHIAPDPTSMIFWLKNRKPNEWRDRRELELDGTVGLVQISENIDISALEESEDD